MSTPPPRFLVHSLVLTVIVGIVVCVSSDVHATDTRDVKKIFSQRCTACHTYGRGVKVGPDLKGVTLRRTRPWLLRFVRSSQSVIKAGDPVAVGLFQEFKQQRMPDWTDLSETQVGALMDWLAANGPDQKEPDEVHAEWGTPADVERARALFHGQLPFTFGGMACGSCHAIRENGTYRGGTLGPELTTAYDKYQDGALTLFLKRPCSTRGSERTPAGYLTPRESFALKAFLRSATLVSSDKELP